MSQQGVKAKDRNEGEHFAQFVLLASRIDHHGYKGIYRSQADRQLTDGMATLGAYGLLVITSQTL